MSGPSIEVDHVSVRKAASNVDKAKNEVQGHLSQVAMEGERLSAGWTGPAAAAFQQLMGRWSGDAQRLLRAMDEIAETLKKSAGTHEQANADALHSVNRIASTLNP